MPQINVEFDEETVKDLDRIAAKQSIRRPELLRRTIRELIDAEATGRDLFVPTLKEVTPDQVAHLIREVEAMTGELERVTRQNVKLDSDLRKALTAYESDAASARERGLREAEEALERRLEPLKTELAEHRAETARIVEEHPKFQQLEAGQAKVMKAIGVQQPPVQFHLGKHKLPVWWPLWALATLAALGIGLVITLSAILPDRWLAVPVTDRMLGGRGFCALVDARMGEGACARWIDAPKVSEKKLPAAKGRTRR